MRSLHATTRQDDTGASVDDLDRELGITRE